MHIENQDVFFKWLVEELTPITDADPNALAKYVLALVKKPDKSPEELKESTNDQLAVFLADHTTPFVDKIFAALLSKSYLPAEPATSEPRPDHRLVMKQLLDTIRFSIRDMGINLYALKNALKIPFKSLQAWSTAERFLDEKREKLLISWWLKYTNSRDHKYRTSMYHRLHLPVVTETIKSFVTNTPHPTALQKQQLQLLCDEKQKEKRGDYVIPLKMRTLNNLIYIERNRQLARRASLVHSPTSPRRGRA